MLGDSYTPGLNVNTMPHPASRIQSTHHQPGLLLPPSHTHTHTPARPSNPEAANTTECAKKTASPAHNVVSDFTSARPLSISTGFLACPPRPPTHRGHPLAKGAHHGSSPPGRLRSCNRYHGSTRPTGGDWNAQSRTRDCNVAIKPKPKSLTAWGIPLEGIH